MEIIKQEPSSQNRTDEVKVFLKIKSVEFGDKPYYQVSENRQEILLFDPINKATNVKVNKFLLDKIFTNENENSYIYEEICRDSISESLKGRSFCFMSYGESTSDKNSIIFGGDDCYTNINSRGIFLRYLESYMGVISSDKNFSEWSLSMSYLCVNGGKMIDLVKFMGVDVSQMSEKDVLDAGTDIKGNCNVIDGVKRLQTGDSVKETIQFLRKFFDLFYKLNEYNAKLYSKSHFVFVIRVNNNGKEVSTITFVILAGSEMLSTAVTNPKVAGRGKIGNTQTVIENTSTFDAIIDAIALTKKPDADREKLKEVSSTENLKLITVLKKLVFISEKTKFRIVGCIFPNTGVYDNVWYTLMFLFECKKTIFDKSQIPNNKTQQVKKDDILFEFENKIQLLEKRNAELNEKNVQQRKKMETIDNNYKKNLETLKIAFNFEGDINNLISNNEYTKEAKYARSIRDAVDTVRIKNKRIEELDNKIEELKEEIKKMKAESDLKENDRTMVKIFTQLKEDRVHEENKLKLTFEQSAQMEELIKKNQYLESLIEHYKKEIQDKAKVIQKLPQVLQDHISEKKEMATKKAEIKSQMEVKFKKTMKEEHKTFINELKASQAKYESLLSQTEKEAKEFKTLYYELKSRYDDDIKRYKEELIKIHDIVKYSIETYKKCFDSKKFGTNMNSITNFTLLLKAKESFDKINEKTGESLTRYLFPLMFVAVDEKKGRLIRDGNIEELKAEPFEDVKKPHQKDNQAILIKNEVKLKETRPQKENEKDKDKEMSISASDISEEIEKIRPTLILREELEAMEKSEIMAHTLKLQEKVSELEKYFEMIIKSKRGYKIKNFMKTSEENEEIHKIFNEHERLRQKLEEQVKINNRNKIIISSHERMIEKLNSENFYLKDSVIKKSTNDKLSFPMFSNRPDSHTTASAFPGSPRTLSASSKSGFLQRPITGRVNPNTQVRPATAQNFLK